MNDDLGIRDRFDSMGLPPPMEDITELVHDLVDLAVDYNPRSFGDVDPPEVVARMYQSEPPDRPLDREQILEFVRSLIPNFPSTSDPHFMAYVPSHPTWLSRALASLTPYFNQFVGTVQGSPAGTAVESLVIRWVADLLTFPRSSFGCFTSGGSMANMTAIYTGMVHTLGRNGVDFFADGLRGARPVFYLSDQTHNSVVKSLLMLGVGKRSVKVVPSDADFRLTAAAVRREVDGDIAAGNLPLMVVATIGTTNTGAIDDIDGLRELCDEHGMWLHVDGAYGAFSLLSTESSLKSVPSDSIALDCHKWLYTPFEAGIALVRDHKAMRRAFDISAEYLRDTELGEDIELQRNFRSYGLPLTREMRGLKVWGVFAELGVQGLRHAISRDILKARYLTALLRRDDRFELVGRSELSIVCFRYRGTDPDNRRIIDMLNSSTPFFLSSTILRGREVLRVCFINRGSDLGTVDRFFSELDRVVSSLEEA